MLERCYNLSTRKSSISENYPVALCQHLASEDDFNQWIFILLIQLKCPLIHLKCPLIHLKCPLIHLKCPLIHLKCLNFRNTSLERTLAAPCQTHSGTTSHQQPIPAYLSVQQKLPLLGTWRNEITHHWVLLDPSTLKKKLGLRLSNNGFAMCQKAHLCFLFKKNQRTYTGCFQLSVFHGIFWARLTAIKLP